MFHDVLPTQAREVLEQNGARFVDVRTVEEFAAGHVPGALNIPLFVRSPAGEMTPNPGGTGDRLHPCGRDRARNPP